MHQSSQTVSRLEGGAGFIVPKCKINDLVRIEMIQLKFIMMAAGPSVALVVRVIRITVPYAAV
jgi:hypothetical protein